MNGLRLTSQEQGGLLSGESSPWSSTFSHAYMCFCSSAMEGLTRSWLQVLDIFSLQLSQINFYFSE